jgi:hypothetical protein
MALTLLKEKCPWTSGALHVSKLTTTNLPGLPFGYRNLLTSKEQIKQKSFKKDFVLKKWHFCPSFV